MALVGVPFSFFVSAGSGLWIGAAAGVAFFVGREHAQRQQEIQSATGVLVIDQNPLVGFLHWSPDAVMDVLVPWFCCAVAVVIGRVGIWLL